jgi:hypothetical protein
MLSKEVTGLIKQSADVVEAMQCSRCACWLSAAAGILLTLCQADPKHEEAVVEAKAGPDSCCQVLHACLACHDCIPRHVLALLASLAGSPPVSAAAAAAATAITAAESAAVSGYVQAVVLCSCSSAASRHDLHE